MAARAEGGGGTGARTGRSGRQGRRSGGASGNGCRCPTGLFGGDGHNKAGTATSPGNGARARSRRRPSKRWHAPASPRRWLRPFWLFRPGRDDWCGVDLDQVCWPTVQSRADRCQGGELELARLAAEQRRHRSRGKLDARPLGHEPAQRRRRPDLALGGGHTQAPLDVRVNPLLVGPSSPTAPGGRRLL